MQKPARFSQTYADSFQDRAVVEAYRYRPPYPPAVFTALLDLISTRPRHVLDVGCGTGNLARTLVTGVERVDAVDCSREMIEHGRRLPNGDHLCLRWLHGRAEDMALDPPYALVTAGESLHWLDWQIVLPRFHHVLAPGGCLAIVTHDTVPDSWSMLGEIISRHRVDGGYEPFDMIGQLEEHGLFKVAGETKIEPVPFEQSIDDLLESYHSRSNLSRSRLGERKAAAFDKEARQLLLGRYGAGMLTLQVTAHIVWGIPQG